MKTIPDFPNYEISQNGIIRNKSTGRVLKSGCDTFGYLLVVLRKNKKSHTRLIHRLVLETFVGPRPDKMECCHNNGNPLDNRLENLRWDTRSANQYDAVKHGTHVNNAGINSPSAKLNELQIRIIRKLLQFGVLTQKEIGGVFGVSHATISDIKCHKTWSPILKEIL